MDKLAIVGLVWITALLVGKAVWEVREERRRRHAEWEAARRLLLGQRWRTSSLIEARVRAAAENRRRSR